MATTTFRRRSLVWPVILIGIGVILLLQNFGLISWNLWTILTRWWPAVLILVGLEILLNRSNPWLAALAAAGVVAVLVVGGVVASALGYGDYNWSSFAVNAPASEHIYQPLGQNERANVEVQFGAGDLAMASLGSDSPNFVEADFEHQGTGRKVDRSYRCADKGTCTLRLSAQHQRFNFGQSGGPESWNVLLSPRLPLDVRVQSGASRLDLDMSGLSVTNLRIEAGASNGTIKLPRGNGTTPVTIKAGAADLTIQVPEGTAARVRLRGALGSFLVDGQRFPAQGGLNVSPDFDRSANRLDIDIDAGVAKINVQ